MGIKCCAVRLRRLRLGARITLFVCLFVSSLALNRFTLTLLCVFVAVDAQVRLSLQRRFQLQALFHHPRLIQHQLPRLALLSP
jgi:hypothetical protein